MSGAPWVPPGWSGWEPLPLGVPVEPAVLTEILDGGQAFRWRYEKGSWLGQFEGTVVRLCVDADGIVRWSAHATLAPATGAALAHYFDLARHPQELADALPWRSDTHLAACLADFTGLRILRQPFGETLLCFLCSATKQIVQIKQMIGLLAERHGTALVTGSPAIGSATVGHSSLQFHRLPTWAELALIPEADLRACQFGFRARWHGLLHGIED